MTTTIVLGRTDDGYLVGAGATFNDARNGGSPSVGVGNLSYWGHRKISGSSFEVREAAIGFTFPAVDAGELVVSAVVQLVHSQQNSPSRVRNMYLKPQNWVPGGLTVADFMTAGALQGAATWSTIQGGQGVGARTTYQGGDLLVAHLEGGATSATWVAVSKSTQDGSPVPVGDELATFWSGNSSGTTNDPRLVYTTVPRHSLVPVLGASVSLSDGSQAYLTYASGVVTLRHQANSLATWSTAIPADFHVAVNGAQGFSLAADDEDNVYVVGRSAAAPNSMAVQAWNKNLSGIGWSGSGPVRTASMPAHTSALNNFAAAWHPTAGGTLVAMAAHTAGDAVNGPMGNDMAYALWSSSALRTITSSNLRAVGAGLGMMFPAREPGSTVFNSHANETGTGLDVVADPVQRDWGYAFSFNKGTALGENAAHYVGRYILNPNGDGFYHFSTENSEGWGVKDANAKLRLVSIGSGQVAAVSADDDGGFGLSINIWQAVGTSVGFVQLGQVLMDLEGLADFPTPADFSMASNWDVVYSSLDNKLWLYYVKAGTQYVVRRTSIDLDTYQATGVVEEVHDYTSTQAIMSIRLPRGRWATTHTWLDVALKAVSGGAMTLASLKSTFNMAPLAPTLTPHANYDATTATNFLWTFRDTAGDTQSAYQFQVEDVADGSVDIDTGKTASAVASRTVAASTLANPKSYRWRVKTWDALDVEGAWSDYGTFSTTAGGAVTVTDPAIDNAGGVETDDYVVRWSVTGTVQASYRVVLIRTDTGATVSDTGWIASVATQLLIGGMLSDVQHQVQVRVRNAALVESAVGSRLITPSYAVPEVPLVTATPFPEDGYVLITVDNPIPGQPANGAPEWDFEGIADGGAIASWGVTDGTWVASTTYAHKGTVSGKLTSVGTPVRAYARTMSLGVTPGTRYTCRMWAYSNVGGIRAQVAIDWRLSGGAYISTSSGPEIVLPAATWTFLSITAQAPDNAVEAGYGPTLPASPVAGTVVYCDEIALPEASDRPDVARNLVLRRPVGSTEAWDVVGECDPDGSVRDYTCPAWVPVQYMVRGES